MKTFKRLTLGALLLAASVAGASVSDAEIEVIVVTAKYAGPVAIEEIVVTAKYPAPLTVEKLQPAMPVQLPSLKLEIAGIPEV